MITIRTERDSDSPQIYEINARAFDRDSEAMLVTKLRAACSDCLSLVASIKGQIVGHAMFTPVTIETMGATVKGMGLGPIAVLPSKQKRGIGTQLIESGLDTLRQHDCPFGAVLGHPTYYPRFGFLPASRFGLRCQWSGILDDVFMALILSPGSMNGISGLARYRKEFDEVA